MHDNLRIFPQLPSKDLSDRDREILRDLEGTVWQTCWEYALSHRLTEGEGAAFWTAANLIFKAMGGGKS